MSFILPTRAEWKTQTSARIGRRGVFNPELFRIDDLLDEYQPGGGWSTSGDKLIRIRNIIAVWETRRRAQPSERQQAMEDLRDIVDGRLNELVRQVAQCEYLFLPSTDATRFMITTGVTSCIVVVLYDPDTLPHAATLAHTQQSNPAGDSVQRMVQASAGFNGNWCARLVGGRAVNKTKFEELQQALIDNGITQNNIHVNPDHVLRNVDVSASIHVAFDRHTGSYELFTEEPKPLWSLRDAGIMSKLSDYSGRAKPPLLQPYDNGMVRVNDNNI